MARPKLAGQYTISQTDTPEQILEPGDVASDFLHIKNLGDKAVYINGSDEVSPDNGFPLDKGSNKEYKTEVRITDYSYGGKSGLWIYGPAGITVAWIAQ